MPGPRAGTHVDSDLEVYLIPSVTVPPTNTKKGQGVRMGSAEATTGNGNTNVIVSFQGDLRQDAASDPTLSIAVKDLGSAPSSYSASDFKAAVDQVIANGGNSIGTVFGLLATVANFRQGGISNPENNDFSRVPRFGISRSGYDQISGGDDPDYVGLTTNFARWPSDDASVALPAHPSASGWTVVGQPRILRTKNGKLQVWWIAKRTSDSKYDIIVYKYDPATDTGFEYLAALNGTATGEYFADKVNQSGIRTALSDIDLTIEPLGLAPVTLGDDVFCTVIATYGSYTSKEGLIYGFRLSGTEVVAADSDGLRAAIIPDIWLNDAVADFAGIDAVEDNGRVQLAVAILCFGFCSLAQSRTIILLSTSDFKSWGSSGVANTNSDYFLPTPDMISLGSFNKVTSRGSAGTITRITKPYNAPTSQVRYACTNNGYILKSTDAGRSWITQATPVQVDKLSKPDRSLVLYDIHAATENAVWAVGDMGTVLRTIDGGTTWALVRRSFLNAYLSTAPTVAQSTPNMFFYGVWAATADKAWVCGEGGKILYTANGGTNWTTIIDFKSTYTFTSIVSTSSDVIIAGGYAGLAGKGGGATTRTTRAIEIRDATETRSEVTDAKVTLFSSGTTPFLGSTISGTTVGDSPIVRMYYDSVSTNAYAVDEKGFVYKYVVGSGSTPGVWSLVANSGFGPRTARDIVALSSADVMVLAGRQYGLAQDDTAIFRTATATSSTAVWRTVRVGGGVSSLSMVDVDTGVCAGKDGIFWADGIQQERCDPSFVKMETGEIGMACNNITDGQVEFWRHDQGGVLEKLQSSLIQFVETGGTSDSVITAPKPYCFTDLYGDILLYTQYSSNPSARQRLVSPRDSRGGSFGRGDAGSLGVPFGYAAASLGISNEKLARFSDMKAFQDGRLFMATSFTDSSKVGIYVSRDWAYSTTDNPTVYAPILAGRYQWVGIDNLYVKFSGVPQIGDSWYSEPQYDFSTDNLVTETPSNYWLGPLSSTGSSQVIVPQLDLIWDRQATAVTNVLGDGKYWDVTGIGLFGKNFREFSLGLSNNGSTYTTISATETIASGTATPPTGESAIYSVLYDSSKNFIPSQFKPGLKQYYLQIDSGEVFKIIDNSRKAVMIENAVGIGASVTYNIFSDAYMLTEDDWADSTTRFARYVRLRIPTQYAVGNEFKIGTAIIGNHVTYVPYTGNESRHRYVEGFAWSPMPFTARQQAENGITSVQHLGMQQKWSLNYEHAYWWDRDMQVNGLLPRLQQAFAIQLDGSDPQSAQLVRIANYQTANSFADRYSASIELEQVV